MLKTPITAIVLAGGLSSRMNGNDKGLLLLRDKPLYEHVIDKIKPQVNHIIINANHHIDLYKQLGYQVVQDQLSGFLGPLAGIYSGLINSTTDWNLVVSCDTPFLPDDLVFRLSQKIANHQAAYVFDGEQIHPTILLINRSVAEQIKTYLAQEHRKLRLFLQHIDSVKVDFSDLKQSFININTPQELAFLGAIFMKLLAVCGYSGSGKTTLLKKLIPALKQQGIRLGVIKHTHHDIEFDVPGKDSYELRKSGADQVIIASNHRWALVCETPTTRDNLLTLAKQFHDVDLVLVEGFKDETMTKIVCYRQLNDKPLFFDQYTLAIASDCHLDINIALLDINDIDMIVKFIRNYVSK